MDIFVFGSNLEGKHGKGAALEALKNHGAIYGQGEGRQGNSYAIPTKSTPYKSLSLEEIEDWVIKFLWHAHDSSEDTFNMTRIGCGLAGYKDYQIAPMFKNHPPNVNLPAEWKEFCD